LLSSCQFNARTGLAWNRPAMSFCFMPGATPNLIRIGWVAPAPRSRPPPL
jgi:hypothetical protein